MKRSKSRIGKMLLAAVAVVLSATVGLCLAACGDGVLAIEGVEWQFATRQTADGTIDLASAAQSAHYPEAPTGEISIETEGGVIVLTDENGEEVATGEYVMTDKNDLRSVYSFESGGDDWTAVVSVSKHWDMHEGTLIVSNGAVAYTFTADVTGMTGR